MLLRTAPGQVLSPVFKAGHVRIPHSFTAVLPNAKATENIKFSVAFHYTFLFNAGEKIYRLVPLIRLRKRHFRCQQKEFFELRLLLR